jgi:hypothetical protein
MMVSKGAEKYAGITEREKYKYVCGNNFNPKIANK